MSIDVVRHDPEWPVLFAEEAAALAELLRAWLVAPVEHIGSTSVPGLDAKPILDMMAGVRNLTSAREAIPALRERGYLHVQHRPATLAFHRLRPGYPEQHTHHLHLTQPGSSLWRERLAFRDALRADADLADRYRQLKQQLAAESPDMAAYTSGKRAFVVAVLAGAGISADDWRSRQSD